MNYMTKVIPQIPDSIIPEIDMLIEKSRADSNLFRYMLITLFNYYGKSKIMGMDAVQVHIADISLYIQAAFDMGDSFISERPYYIDKGVYITELGKQLTADAFVLGYVLDRGTNVNIGYWSRDYPLGVKHISQYGKSGFRDSGGTDMGNWTLSRIASGVSFASGQGIENGCPAALG